LPMRTPMKTQPTIHLHEVKAVGRRIHLRAELAVDLPLPAQDEHLPAALERAVDDAGQRLKRLLFQHALEQADLQLLLRHVRGGPGRWIAPPAGAPRLYPQTHSGPPPRPPPPACRTRTPAPRTSPPPWPGRRLSRSASPRGCARRPVMPCPRNPPRRPSTPWRPKPESPACCARPNC